MRKVLHILQFFVLPMLLFSSCQKKEFDDYYARPASLAPPIYQQLQARGNFNDFLACIDKAGYKETLSAGGYWTIFAPNDSAFANYMQAHGIASADKIDSVTARKIVTYALVYNAYTEDELSQYQSPVANAGNTGDPNAIPFYAYKRKTAFYDFVYSDTVNGKVRKVVATNTNVGIYIPSDNGNKYVPYFLQSVFAGQNLSAADYNYFFPGVPFTGFNVVDANVTEKNIPAENGIIHIVDKVLFPLQNLDEYLSSNPDYSEFKKLLNMTAAYTYDPDVTHRYQALTHAADSVFVKSYTGLAYAPNNENYASSGTDGQIDGFTMFVPTNDVLKAYEKKILVNYGTLAAAPPSVLYSLINAHMWINTVWPSQINGSSNSQQETPTFSSADVTDKKILSNGFFYGMNSVQDANVFRTVYGKAFLDPKYSLMTRALDAEVKYVIYLPTSKYTLFMMSNDDILAAGYNYYEDHGAWGYLRPGTTGSIDYLGAQARIYRILQTSALPTPNGEMDNLSGKGIVEAYNGEYVKFDNGKVYASGNEETNTPVIIDSSKTTVNGKVYYTSGLLTFTEKSIDYTLSQLAANDPDNYGYFYNYLKNSPTAILSISPGSFYTFFIPTNAAIQDAVNAGLLPGDANGPDFTPNAADAQKVADFIDYHILDKNAVVPDGKKFGAFPTLLKNVNGDIIYLTVNNQLNNMELRDTGNHSAKVNIDASNHLGDHIVIHSIDNYLNYNQ